MSSTTTRIPTAQDDTTEWITIRFAANLTGKSIDTIRRWKRSHGLEERRNQGDPTAPILVKKSQVLAVAAQVATIRNSGDVHNEAAGQTNNRGVGNRIPIPTESTSGTIAAMQAHIATLERQVFDVRAERDQLKMELSETKQELAKVSRELLEMSKAKTSVEQELVSHKGIRGLLKEFLPRKK